MGGWQILRQAMPVAAVALILFLAVPGPDPADARSIAVPGHQPVHVNVSFNMQVPISDMDEETLANSQQDARKLVYRMTTRECEILEEVIAESCRLTHINVSTQVQHHNNPATLYVNGNATFAITLKEPATAEQ